MIPELLAGDIILSRRDHWLSKSIRWFGKQKTGGARVSHAAISLGKLTEKPEVIESLWRVTRNKLSKYEGQKIIVWRRKDLTLGQRNEIVLKAVSIEKQGYGFFKIPLLALDSVFRTYWFSRTLGVSNFKVCSNLIAWSYEKTLKKKKYFGAPWKSIQPDTLDDYCNANRELYDEIYSTL